MTCTVVTCTVVKCVMLRLILKHMTQLLPDRLLMSVSAVTVYMAVECGMQELNAGHSECLGAAFV